MKPQSSPIVKIIEYISQSFDGLEQTPRRLILGGLIFFFFMSASTTLLLGYYAYQPEVDAFFQKATLTPIIFSAVDPTATPQCVPPTLTLGNLTYPIDLLPGSTSGLLPATNPLAGTAWWVADTTHPFVFLLTPPPGSTDPSSQINLGGAIVVQWENCSRENFILTSFEIGAADATSLFAQANPGVAVVIQPFGGTPGYILYGQPAQPINPPTPESNQEPTPMPSEVLSPQPTQLLPPEPTQELLPQPTQANTSQPTQPPTQLPTQAPTQLPTSVPTQQNAVNIDISFEDLIVSADQQNLQVVLTITNLGSSPLTMTNGDLSLTGENNSPLAPQSVDPVLPQVIPPGGSLGLTITFPHPGGTYAELRVFDTFLDLFF
jgi:hypothetical protein